MKPDPYAEFSTFKTDYPAPGVLRLTLRGVTKVNTLDATAHRHLADIWRVVDRDRDVLAVILCAEGRFFCGGGDIGLVEHMTVSFEERANSWREARDLVANMTNCAKPIVSAVQGAAAGAGLAAALCADITVVARNAKLVDAHVKLGVAAGDHAAVLWPLLCGMAKAKYYLLLNEPLTGEKAEEIGLVSLAVDESELQETALSIAKKLAEGSPSAIQWTKYSLNNWLRFAGPIYDTSLALEMLGFSSPEAVEGIAALKEKRPPRFARKSPF